MSGEEIRGALDPQDPQRTRIVARAGRNPSDPFHAAVIDMHPELFEGC